MFNGLILPFFISVYVRYSRGMAKFDSKIPGKFKNCKLSGQEYFDVINCLNRESVIISGEKLKNKEYLSSTFNNCINFKLHKKIYNQYIIYWAKIIDKNKN